MGFRIVKVLAEEEELITESDTGGLRNKTNFLTIFSSTGLSVWEVEHIWALH